MNMSRAIATPSASAASLPFSCAFLIRGEHLLGTETPGTSFARNSALRKEISGQIPATIGVLNCSTRFRNRLELARVEHRLCHRELRAGVHLPREARQLAIQVARARGSRRRTIAHLVAPPSGLLPGSSP